MSQETISMSETKKVVSLTNGVIVVYTRGTFTEVFGVFPNEDIAEDWCVRKQREDWDGEFSIEYLGSWEE